MLERNKEGWKGKGKNRLAVMRSEPERERKDVRRCPSPQRPAPNFDVTDRLRDTKRAPLSRTPHLIHRTLSSAHQCWKPFMRSLGHLLNPEPGLWAIIFITTAARTPLGLSPLRIEAHSFSHDAGSVLDCWWEHSMGEDTATPHPDSRQQQMWQKRRGGKKESNRISLPLDPSLPHLGEQYPSSSWGDFVSLPTLKIQKQTDTLTHWPAAPRGEHGTGRVAALFMQFNSVLGQLLGKH